MPGAIEAADHLVDDEQDVVFLQDRLNRLEIALGRWHHPAGAEERLGDEGGHRVGALLRDQRFEIGGEARAELLLGLAGRGKMIVMRAVGVQDIGNRQIEGLLCISKAGQAAGRDRYAVISALAGDDLLLLRTAENVVVIPDQLDLGVVRLRPGIGEEHLRHRNRGAADQVVGKLDRRLDRLVREAMIEGKRIELPGRRLDEALFAEAERRAPQAGEALDIALAGNVVDIDAFAAGDDMRADLFMQRRVGIGVKVTANIARMRRIDVEGHGVSPGRFFIRAFSGEVGAGSPQKMRSRKAK